jgi:phage/plasmid-like protein (TIGR03299 family)
MAHELERLLNGKYSMAAAESSGMSWHGLETKVPDNSDFETWYTASGMNFNIERSTVQYGTDGEHQFPSKHVLYRNDDNRPLSVVSSGYQIVQPKEILYFFQELCKANNLTMDTAGVLRGGSKFWALAKTGNAFSVGNNDIVKQYVLLASSCDTSMSTIAKHTSMRVVCSNTFHVAVNNGESAIRVNHSTMFDADKVKMDLGLLDKDFSEFGDYADSMQKVKVSDNDAKEFYAKLVGNKKDYNEVYNSRLFKSLWDSYKKGRGAEDTAWGLFNGVTYMVDHKKGRSADSSLNSSMFGMGAALKVKAWKEVQEMV